MRLPRAVLLGIGLLLMASLPALADALLLEPGLYRLHSHRDGQAAPPLYGLRLDGLLSGDAEDVFSFDFDGPGAAVFLELSATSARLFGTVHGGRDGGERHEAPELWDVEMRYAIDSASDGGGGLVSVGAPGANTGFLRRRSDSTLFTLADLGGPPSFRIGKGHRATPDVVAGWGWVRHSGAPELLHDSDWLFEIEPASKRLHVEITDPVDGDRLGETPIAVAGTWSRDGQDAAGTASSEPPPLLLLPLDENGGSVARDATGRGRNGILAPLEREPAWTTGRLGGALAFDGRDDRLKVEQAATDLEGLAALTISVWLRAHRAGVDRGLFDTESRASGHDDHLALRYDRAGWGGGGKALIKAGLRTTSGSTQIESSSKIQTTAWQHVALRWQSGGELELYVDGQRDIPSYSQGPLDGRIKGVEELTFGRGPKGRTWDGRLDEIRVYDRALEPAEIAVLAKGRMKDGSSESAKAAPPTITVNGIPADILSDSAFVAVGVPLVEGPNRLVARAADASGSAHDSIDVLLDTLPPRVRFTTPLDGARLEPGPLLVEGHVEDASPIEAFTLNGLSLPLTSESETRSRFQTTLVLSDEVLPLDGVATDVLGRVGGERIAVTSTTSDDTPPEGPEDGPDDPPHDADPPLEVHVTTPPEGAIVSSSRISVSGLVSDPRAEVSIGGVVATVSGESWSASAVGLVEGENLLTALATRLNEQAEDERRVRLNLPPRIVITSPRDAASLREGTVDVEGYVDDPTALTDVNGVAASVEPGGRYLASGVSLVPGPNRLQARAVDPLGAVGKDQVEVIRLENAAGQLRMVLVIPRSGNALGLGAGPEADELRPLVVEDVDEFTEALRRAGWAPERFEPALAEPAHAYGPLHLFVFAEAGLLHEPVHVPALSASLFEPRDSRLLLPIQQLEAELELVGLHAYDLRDMLLPRDFEPNGFVRFSLFEGASE